MTCLKQQGARPNGIAHFSDVRECSQNSCSSHMVGGLSRRTGADALGTVKAVGTSVAHVSQGTSGQSQCKNEELG